MYTPLGLVRSTFLVVLVYGPALSAEISGVPRISDGDTLAIGKRKIRLEGIDAP